jgi:DNA-binding transcriptional MerR regulator
MTRRNTPSPPAVKVPRIGHKDLPPRADRDWVLSTELIEEAGITYRQLDYWCHTGLLTPRGDIPGSGWARSFDQRQVERANCVALLLQTGFSLQVIRDVIDDFQAHGTAQIGRLTITIHHPSGDTAA